MKFDNYSEGPWVECHDQVLDGDGFAILRATENPLDKTQHRANVQRIVACINACAGYPTDDLEDVARMGGIPAVKAGIEAQLGWLKDVTAQRDELLAALERLLPWAEAMDWAPPGLKYTGDHPLAVARDAITKAKGGAS